MLFHWMKEPKGLIVTPFLLLLLVAVSCGGTAATPVVAEKVVVKEVPAEKVAIKEVFREVMAIATPVVSQAGDVPDYVAQGASKHFNGVFPVVPAETPGSGTSTTGAASTPHLRRRA